MARCSYHPDVETEMRCAECGKPICPKEMVLTPVGYKCPEDARPVRGQYTFVKPHQLARAVGVGVVVGTGGGLLAGAIGYGGIILGLLWGAATSEAVRRASGGHRGGTVGAVAAVSIAFGGLLGWWFLGLWFVTTIIAIVVALVQLAVLERR